MGPGFPADCFAKNQAHHPGRRNWAAPGARKRRGRAVKERFLAVVNPAAGGGRCGRLAPTAIEKLRAAGVPLEVIESRGPGQATQLVREAYARGYRKFLAVGGDGPAYEIVNGLFPGAADGERAALVFLPLGTGNSFLRDFTDRGVERAATPSRGGRGRACDVLRLTHKDGVLHYTTLLSIGFTADVAAITNRKFKRLGELGYLLGVLTCLARLRRRAFPLRANGEAEFDRRRCLFLSFSNSKFTGGKMIIAPMAGKAPRPGGDVCWGPSGRPGLIRNPHTLYHRPHPDHPPASRPPGPGVEFE